MLTFEDWVTTGIENGWCSEPVCETHEGLPLTPGEETFFDLGNDPCVFAVRIWD